MDQHLNTFAVAPKCVCLDDKIENCRLHYGRFAISPLLPGQAITIGTAIRRALLGDVQGAYIFSAYVVGASHEYCTLEGVRESVHDILLNLKEIVVKSNSFETQEGVILFQGPGIVTAEHIQLPSTVKVVDKTQYIAKVEASVKLTIHLTIEKSRGWHIRKLDPTQKSTFPVNGIIKPIRNINYSIHSIGEGLTLQELLILEVWTNGALTPQESLSEASRNLTLLFQSFISFNTNNNHNHNADSTALPLDILESNPKIDKQNSVHNEVLNHSASSIRLSKWLKQESIYNPPSVEKQINAVDKSLLEVSIDQLELPVRASNCLQKAGIYTILQLLQYTQEDLLKLKNLGKRSAEHIVKALEYHFGLYLPVK